MFHQHILCAIHDLHIYIKGKKLMFFVTYQWCKCVTTSSLEEKSLWRKHLCFISGCGYSHHCLTHSTDMTSVNERWSQVGFQDLGEVCSSTSLLEQVLKKE